MKKTYQCTAAEREIIFHALYFRADYLQNKFDTEAMDSEQIKNLMGERIECERLAKLIESGV